MLILANRTRQKMSLYSKRQILRLVLLMLKLIKKFIKSQSLSKRVKKVKKGRKGRKIKSLKIILLRKKDNPSTKFQVSELFKKQTNQGLKSTANRRNVLFKTKITSSPQTMTLNASRKHNQLKILLRMMIILHKSKMTLMMIK